MSFSVLVHCIDLSLCTTEAKTSSSRFRYITNILFFSLAVLTALYGATYAYLLHHLANGVCAWLVVIHLSGSGFSLSALIQILEGGDLESHVKKRP